MNNTAKPESQIARTPAESARPRTRREGFRWRNPYIDLIQTQAHNLVAPTGRVFSDDERSDLRARLAPYVDSPGGVLVELGSGMGNHLVAQALRSPQAFLVGFELRFKRLYRSAEKADIAGAKNLLIVQDDARHLALNFAPGTLKAVFVNFPDPWSKRKWLKHRLLTDKFVATFRELLCPGGVLAYKTDQQQAFEGTLEVLKADQGLEITKLSYDLHNSEFAKDNLRTEFESLFVGQKLPIYMVEARKR